MIIAFILAFFIGVFSVLLFQAFLLYKWWTSKAADPRKLYPQRTRVVNPEFVAEYSKKDSATEKESCMSLNLLLAFLWREWRDSPQMREFFLKKMNLEFSDMMQGRAASKLIEQITIEEFSLGSSLPVIKGATIMKLGADPREVPQELDIALDLEYSGGCHMAIRVDMLFNKSVYLAIKLVYMKGRARLQLSRCPLTHWSLAFYEEPEVEFEAESQFEGKNLPQLTSLIISHLRKSIQKKHTLPSYKIRYHPFFRNLSPQEETQELYVHNSLVTVGTLKVSVLRCTRLPEIENGHWYYCTLSVDIFPWSQLAENRRAMWPSFEIEISRDSTDISFGLTLSKEVSEDDLGKTIVIGTIIGGSPAFNAGVMTKDLLVAVDGQKIESLKQAAKMIKSKLKFTATVQRPPSQMAQPTGKGNSINQDGTDTTMVNFKNVTVNNESDSDDEFVNIVVPLLEPHADSELEKSTVREILSRSTELKQKAGKKLKGKQGKKASPALSDIDNSSMPKVGLEQGSIRTGSSGKDSKSEMGARTITDQEAQEVDKKGSPPQAYVPQPPESNQKKVPVSSFSALDGFDNKKTKDVPACSDPEWNETVEFKILKKDQYLNVCVWSKSQEKNEKNVLVGYVTVPLMEVALQCVLVGSKSYEECFVLVSPHSDRVISSHPHLRNHSGLKESLCCGDITLCFHHTPSLADCDESILKKMVSLDDLMPQNEGKDPLASLEPPQHQFILTQFYFPTRCRYCSKKVWTNVALQCRTCSMICHKKCLRSCMRYTHCIHANLVKASWFGQKSTTSQEDDKRESDEESKQNEKTREDGSPASVTAESTDHTTETEKGDELESETKEEAKEEQTVRQTSDANNLEISGNERSGTDSDIETFVTSEKVREAGRELFSNLPLEVRKNKLQDMVDKLQIEIDEESVTRTELYEDRAQAKNKKRKAFIDSQLAKSEERSQALALLMLQYCAGLQSCAEAEELETCQL